MLACHLEHRMHMQQDFHCRPRTEVSFEAVLSCCLLLCRDIFVSVYLDRLLEVDCFNYRHESILYFYITWNDTSAAEKVTNNTLAVLRGESESGNC